MYRHYTFLMASLLLAGCQVLPSRTNDWLADMHRIDSLGASEIAAERDEAMSQYERQPNDTNRMRLGYALSRRDPSLQQLARSREVLSEISDASSLAPFRDMLDREVALLIEMKRERGRTLELEAQLEALKAVEKAMIESRDSMEDRQP